jgi:flagellar biogenesis protein FliO
MMRRLAAVGVFSGGLLLSGLALAIEPAGGSPTLNSDVDAPAERAAPESEAGELPDASVPAPRSWLRQSKKSAQVADDSDAGSAGGWPIAAIVLLGALGGAALYMKYKRGGPSFLIPQTDVRVLSTTRLGSKASLVVAEVHGRTMLLGVTEHSVSELGWIGDAGVAPEASNEALQAAARGEYPSARTQSRFGEALSASMGRGEDARDAPFRGNPNVAALIAANAPEDVVYTRRGAGRAEPRPAPRAVASEQPYGRIEDQVAGLARRRR